MCWRPFVHLELRWMVICVHGSGAHTRCSYFLLWFIDISWLTLWKLCWLLTYLTCWHVVFFCDVFCVPHVQCNCCTIASVCKVIFSIDISKLFNFNLISFIPNTTTLPLPSHLHDDDPRIILSKTKCHYHPSQTACFIIHSWIVVLNYTGVFPSVPKHAHTDKHKET